MRNECIYYALITRLVRFRLPQDKMRFFRTRSEAERTQHGEKLFTTQEMMVLWNRFRRKRQHHKGMAAKWAHTLVRIDRRSCADLLVSCYVHDCVPKALCF